MMIIIDNFGKSAYGALNLGKYLPRSSMKNIIFTWRIFTRGVYIQDHLTLEFSTI